MAFDLLNDPYDPELEIPSICTGDYISLSDDEENELFFGQIFGIERSTAIGTITYTAYDFMKNLLESTGRYNFKNVTPEAVAAQVLADIAVPYNHLEPTGINIKSMICDSVSYYDIIMGAYTQAYRMTGNRYLPMIWQREFGVWPAVYTVSNFTLSDDSNASAVSLSESMDGIKNVIKIYDDKGRQIGEVADERTYVFGIFADVGERKGCGPCDCSKEYAESHSNANITMTAIGDKNCLSGYSVAVKDAATGLSGKYWIKTDKHTWQGETYMMDLELSFEQIMDEKDIETEKEGSGK
ncbi:MAG: hypothetical protein ACLRRJ_03250 [Clostridium sp.]